MSESTYFLIVRKHLERQLNTIQYGKSHKLQAHLKREVTDDVPWNIHHIQHTKNTVTSVTSKQIT